MKNHQLYFPSKKMAPDGRLVCQSRIKFQDWGSHEFYFCYDRDQGADEASRLMNHHLLAHLLPAMRMGGRLRVEGCLDRQLITGLESFMRYWVRWCPERLHMVEIEPEEWAEPMSAAEPGMISCFSGGVDSWYSALQAGDDLGVPLKSVMYMAGHDIPLENRAFFDRCAEQYEAVMRRRSIALIKVETNARETAKKFQLNWGSMAHGIFLAAGMHVFSHSHTAGCLPSSDTPTTLIYPWGSNPVTDPLLSSSGMKMHYHDCMVSKFDKIQKLVLHDDFRSTVRVCYHHHQEPMNCGRCGKCLRTLLMMHVARPDSWRDAFTNIRDVMHALELVAQTDFPWWILQHFEYARDYALQHAEPNVAKAIDQLMESKRKKQISHKMKWRRFFYDAKLRFYRAAPKLSPKGHGK